MNQVLCTFEDVKARIEAGQRLLLAGDEALLRRLPAGTWIGGTIPYFMAAEGGTTTRERLFVNELPADAPACEVKVYDEATLARVYSELPDNGFGVVILPATSGVHLSFALNAPDYPDFASRPLIGWIAGVHLSDLGQVTPKVFDGTRGTAHENAAVVMQLRLPAGQLADIGIVNIFEQGEGDTISFPESGFAARQALVNGELCNFADYLQRSGLNTQLPLVADYHGAQVNVSFQGVDATTQTVNFYAPVFKGVSYRHARPVGNYVAEFTGRVPANSAEIAFSCNCILNFLYSELEGKKTSGVTGPVTFGEVAYQLLNQTLVYLTISETGA